MRVERTSILDAPASRVADLMAAPQTMCFLMRPFVVVDPVEPPAFPQRWSIGRYRVRMRLFGLIPIGWQDIAITNMHADPAAQRWSVHDAGKGPLARRWDHRFGVEPLDERRARYTDRVDVEAGIATVAIWLFAQFVFAWRHHRWHALLRQRGQ
jgi:hypothetical protein